MNKAQRALTATRLLLAEGDAEGVCNRAYYAMFYAAHVALLNVKTATASEYKTHRGLVAAFGRHVVLGGYLDAEFGRAINEVQKVRELSDYTGDAPPLVDAMLAAAQAEAFVAAVEAKFQPPYGAPTTGS